ncbi:SDR family oxidoreductase [Erythrobacter arachoides]|uniref:SDR family oxidoreductase n=1 Tax=Aurantiacibacter arachoides TaxID=1850444 RepID=A0A844ZXL0_9SPHN|nr:SDR family oxidoreductase [Aurantiacibacter arachoides]MXO92468.1 SDR family oxidoreductase [Aurantiacibacter arachoides]GGD56947.1 short-chain dehydrogenase [Aurantiacibacter arachoides]
MQQKAIFITGGGSGIGRAIALKFAAEGWLVGIADRNQAGLDETKVLLPAGRCHAYRFDVTDRAGWADALGAFAALNAGRIDVVANNAGLPSGGPLSEVTHEELDLLIDVNLRGVFYGAKAAFPYLRAAGPGSCLLNTASAAAIHGMANQSVYGATKAGVRSLTESLDAEWAPFGVRSRSLMPSFIDTPLLQAAPNRSRNTPIRDAVVAAGLEFTPVEVVAQAAWDAVHSDKRTHWLVGKTARKLARVAKWMPGLLRRRARTLADAHEHSEGHPADA